MNDKQRVNLMLDADVVAILDDLAGGERKRGQYVSELLRSTYAASQQAGDIHLMDLEALRLLVLGLAGRVVGVEGQIGHMQAQVAAIMANAR